MSLWSALELSSGVVVACLPATRRVMAAYLPMVTTAISQYTSRLGTRRGPQGDAYYPGGSSSVQNNHSLEPIVGDGGGKTKPARACDCSGAGTPIGKWAFDKELPKIPAGEGKEEEEKEKIIYNMKTLRVSTYQHHDAAQRSPSLTQSGVHGLQSRSPTLPRAHTMEPRRCFSPPITAGLGAIPTSRWCNTAPTRLPSARRWPTQDNSLAAALDASSDRSFLIPPRDEQVYRNGDHELLRPARGAHISTELDIRNFRTI